MSPARYLEGVVLLAVVAVAVSAGAAGLRRRLTPDWAGAPARLAEVVLALALVVLVSEALGLVGLFRRAPLVIGLVAAGAVSWAIGRRRGPPPPATQRTARAPAYPLWQLIATVVATATVVAEWGVRTVDALRFGMDGTDTLWYHLPVAARFVQDASIVHLHYLDNDAVTVFYPASSELLHAVGIVLFGSDVLSCVQNLGWLTLSLLAAWCLGRRFGVAPLALVACAVVLGTAQLVAGQPGGAYNDVVVLALVLATLALVVHAPREAGSAPRRGALAVAALAAGLAIGMKYTSLFAVLAITLGVWWLARPGERVRRVAEWSAVVLLAGGFWYLRNLVAVGNPVPQVKLGIGPVALPRPAIASSAISPAHNITDTTVWSDIFLPGLRDAFGPAAAPLLLLAAFGIAAALARPPRTPAGDRDQGARLVAFVALVAFLGYLVTPQPQPAATLPTLFVYNVRFLAPAVTLGLVLVPIVLRASRGWRAAGVAAALGGMLLASQWGGAIWYPGSFVRPYHNDLLGPSSFRAGIALGVVALAAGLALVRRPRGSAAARMRWTLGAAAIAIAVVVGFPVQRHYADHRYARPSLGGIQPKTYAWASTVHHARIAIADLILQYPLYGKDLSNHVQSIGRRGPHGAFAPVRSCTEWRRQVNAGHSDYVVAADNLDLEGRPRSLATASQWTATDPAARRVQAENTVSLVGTQRLSVFALSGPLDPGRCPS
jgi:hypothetical protein